MVRTARLVNMRAVDGEHSSLCPWPLLPPSLPSEQKVLILRLQHRAFKAQNSEWTPDEANGLLSSCSWKGRVASLPSSLLLMTGQFFTETKETCAETTFKVEGRV